jgi:hypothetical protein
VSAVPIQQQGDVALTRDLLAHLDRQIDSARRMLAIVLEQATAIRQREVPSVVRLAGALQAEIHRRELIEVERTALLERAATKLSIGSQDVSMSMLAEMMDPESADRARQRQGELRGLLEEVAREHQTNRSLMQQELAFLDHLLRLAGTAGAYGSGGEHSSSRQSTRLMRRPVFDLEA